MPLFRPSPYEAVITAYEKLVTTLRAEAADREARYEKREGALLEKLMVLTNPAAVRTANSTIRRVGTISDAPPDFMGELPEEFADDPALASLRRPRNVPAAISAVSRMDTERMRVLAEKRREAQERTDPSPVTESKPS